LIEGRDNKDYNEIAQEILFRQKKEISVYLNNFLKLVIPLNSSFSFAAELSGQLTAGLFFTEQQKMKTTSRRW